MAGYSCKMLHLAAIGAIAVMLSVAAPAAAAERAVAASEAGMVKAVPSVIKYRASRRTRLAAWHFDRHGRCVARTERNPNGPDIWRGRQFVLMLGVGY
jgi:hypothetical protein